MSFSTRTTLAKLLCTPVAADVDRNSVLTRVRVERKHLGNIKTSPFMTWNEELFSPFLLKVSSHADLGWANHDAPARMCVSD